MVQLGSKRSPHASWQMIDSFNMREVDSLDDRCVCHCYLTRNSNEARVSMAQTWLYNHREIFLPGLGGSGWIRSTDPVDRMSPSPGQIWSRSIHLGCSDHSVCSALSDHLNLFIIYLINLVVIGWPGWSGHTYQSVHNPIRLLLLLCSFYCLDSGKVVKLLRSR